MSLSGDIDLEVRKLLRPYSNNYLDINTRAYISFDVFISEQC
ncbi:Uncharacterised protein [Corynebacterium renale]|nr:hypothetical protein [Corynebacterium renale]SQG63510.1 Uncharacterised protein [Corynebacterium renale]